MSQDKLRTDSPGGPSETPTKLEDVRKILYAEMQSRMIHIADVPSDTLDHHADMTWRRLEPALNAWLLQQIEELIGKDEKSPYIMKADTRVDWYPEVSVRNGFRAKLRAAAHKRYGSK